MFGFTLLLTVIFQLTCFFCAYRLQIDTLTDLAGSLNFVLLALLTFFSGPGFTRGNVRAIMLTTLVCISRTELGCYLLSRVMRRGKDARFDPIRESLPAFLVFWVFQMVWVWGVSLPVIFVNMAGGSDTAVASDWAGVAVFIAGFLLQVVADWQKDAFRSNAGNQRKWCNIGVWSWSRHPNFAGEIFMWWGAFILATGAFSVNAAGWATIASPLLTMLILLLGSGMPTAEGDNQLRWMQTQEQAIAFAEYRSRTSPLIPLPPSLYKAMPLVVKRWALFEWERYEVKSNTNKPLLPHVTT
jgi:steroid 5-alpha reductase family enzyme